MPNPHRGEIEACLDGTSYRLCLTLRSLAELEHAFGSDDMLALAERFQKGRLSALDAQRIIGAGLRGAGYEILDEAVGRMQAEGGAAGFVDIVARLLSATFGGAGAPIAAAVAGEIVSGIAKEIGGTGPSPQSPPPPCGEGPGVGVRRAVGVSQRSPATMWERTPIRSAPPLSLSLARRDGRRPRPAPPAPRRLLVHDTARTRRRPPRPPRPRAHGHAHPARNARRSNVALPGCVIPGLVPGIHPSARSFALTSGT